MPVIWVSLRDMVRQSMADGGVSNEGIARVSEGERLDCGTASNEIVKGTENTIIIQ